MKKPFWSISNEGGGRIGVGIRGHVGAVISWKTFAGEYREVNNFREEFLKHPPASEIRVNIDSEGGNPHTTWPFYSFLENHPAPKVVTVIHQCHSAAMIFLLLGHVRMYEDATLFLHEGELPVVGGASVLRSVANFLETEERRYRKLFRQHTGLGEKHIKDLMVRNGGTRLSAEEALKLRFIHEIINEPSPVTEDEGETIQNDAPCGDCPYTPWYGGE